jgi:RNA polymerase sigma-70 factor (ECF subfamily)
MSPIEFNQLLTNNLEYIRPYSVFYTRDEESARDLLQDTFCRALANQGKYRNDTNIKGWLLTIMRNIHFNNYRRKRLEKKIFRGNMQEYAIRDLDHGLAVDSSLEAKEILAAVHNLPYNLRIPFYLQFEGYKYQEIAQIVDIAEGTIKSRIHLARKLLMKKVG